MDNDDDLLMLLAIHQSQQDENAPIIANTQNNRGNVYAVANSLETAPEMKMNDVPNEQYTVTEVTRKHLVERILEQLKDENI